MPSTYDDTLPPDDYTFCLPELATVATLLDHEQIRFPYQTLPGQQPPTSEIRCAIKSFRQMGAKIFCDGKRSPNLRRSERDRAKEPRQGRDDVPDQIARDGASG